MSNKAKILVGIYARYSSDMQREESIDAQFRAIEEYCKRNDYEIAAKYADYAISGSLEGRPQFQLMIDDAAKKKFSLVIVHKFDRFSRSLELLHKYERILMGYDVLVESVSEHIENTPSGHLLKNVISSVSQYTVENLSTEVMKGLKENAYNCLSTGGKCLGYDVIDKKYTINHHEADAVRLIFEMYDENNGYTAILKKLNILGYRTKAGNNFGKNSLYGILRNPKYKGEYVYNLIANSGKGNPRNSHKLKDESDIIRIPGGVPAIVSVELFDRIQAKMDKNKYLSGAFTAKNQYLLTGLIYCGECSHAMIGNARKPAKDREAYISYRCSHRDNTLICKNTEIQRDRIESFVIIQLKMYLISPNIVETITEEINKIIGIKSEDFYSHIKQLKRENEDITDKIKNIVRAIENGFDDDQFKESYANHCSRQAEIKNILDEMEKQDNGYSAVSEEQIKEHLENARNRMRNTDFYTLRHILKQFIERVEISKNQIIVTFKISMVLDDSKVAKYTFSRTWDRDMLKNYVA